MGDASGRARCSSRALFSGRDYSAPADNLRTYPVYHPDDEPAGYWEWLQKQKPEPLVDARAMRSTEDWVAAGRRAFRGIDQPLMRTNDPAHIAYARDPASFANVARLRDGMMGVRWVVTDKGVMLTGRECGACHFRVDADGGVEFAAGRGDPPPVKGAVGLPETLQRVVLPGVQKFFGEPIEVAARRMFSVPWAPDERVERLPTMSLQQLGPVLATRHGVFARVNGSPYYGTKIPDLRGLRHNKFMDATGTHRLRGPDDVARYAALVATADSLDFGPHRLLTDAQRRVPVQGRRRGPACDWRVSVVARCAEEPEPGAPGCARARPGRVPSGGLSQVPRAARLHQRQAVAGGRVRASGQSPQRG